MPDQYDAVVAGHICLDIIPDLSGSTLEQFRRTFAPGKLLQVGSAALGTGGPVSNVGLALHKLGIDVRLMGKVGDDTFGHLIRQIVASAGPYLADGMLVDRRVGSSYTIVVNPPGVDRYFLHSPGANDTFVADDVRYDLLQQARLFHFGYPPLMRRMFEDDGLELIEIFRRAKQTGVTTSLDMALPDPSAPAGRANWIAILRATLPYVDIFLPSIEEILFMLRRETFDDLEHSAGSHGIVSVITPQLVSDVSAELMDEGARIVGLKLGNRGFYLRTAGEQRLASMGRGRPVDLSAWANRELWSPCFQADVVGTAGSGDATIAGFLTALLRDLPPEQAVTAAVAVGACNVEAADTLSGIQPWDATLRRVADGWPRYRMIMQTPHWRFDEANGLWQHENRGP